MIDVKVMFGQFAKIYQPELYLLYPKDQIKIILFDK